MTKNLLLAKQLIKECKDTLNPRLDLGNCGISDLDDFPELFECTHLKSLILCFQWWDSNGVHYSQNKGESNNISKLPEQLSSLTILTEFILNGQTEGEKLMNVGVLKNLQLLEHLGIRDQHIDDINFLSALTNLKTLELGFNRISNINPLLQLTKLKYLDIGRNNIEPTIALKELAGLEYLWLYRCGLQNCNFVSSLKNLTTLDISGNEIIDCSPVANLVKLTKLNLAGNKITNFPMALFKLEMQVLLNEYSSSEDGLNLGNGAIESPPIEILQQGRQSILDWFEANKEKLNEIKVILIGDPKAGKTSLLRRLKDDAFDENEPQTDGINIEHIPFGECKHFKKHPSLNHLTAHFWDFGGQEIMNATHQFFLTNRSVYILVLDARKDQKVAEQVRMWVKRIKATGGNSPIIVVANQEDVNPGFGFSNEIDLQQEFPQIKYFLKVSCLSGNGIEEIKQKLEELIPKAELFNTEIDERWIRIMKQLQEETQSKHYLDEARFNKICDDNNLPKSGRKNAINFLNDLGLVLHFDNLNLAEYYVLDPYWITYGVYQIVTSAYAGTQKGTVQMDKLEYIVNEEEDKKQVYKPTRYRKITYDSTNQRRFLVDILNQFKLCFYLPGNEQFIIPDLLDTTEPVTVTKLIRQDANAISFVYDYEYMPNSIMPSIMVEAHWILNEKWRTGCVLARDGGKALVSSYQNRLSITVTGEHKKKREFMAVVRNIVDEINKDLADKPITLIPLPKVNAFAEYEVLLKREKRGKKDYIYNEDKDTEQAFEISQLLEGIPGNEEMREILALQKQILAGTNRIENKLEEQFAYLVEKSNSDGDKIINAIREISSEQASGVTTDILQFMVDSFDINNTVMDERLKQLYTDIKRSDDFALKLKLSIPFIKLLGVDLEAEFDVKSWAKKMYKKYELQVFKLLT